MNIKYKHYIVVENGLITDAFSTGASHKRVVKETDILLHESKSYQFTLNGVENPSLKFIDGFSKYKWVDEVVKTTEEEHQIYIDNIPKPTPRFTLAQMDDIISVLVGL